MEDAYFTIYIDESGDDLIYEVAQWDSDPTLETHCTLLGSIIPHNKKDLLKDTLNQIKMDLFRSKELVLHSVDIRNRRAGFACFYHNPELYDQFKSKMNTLTNDLRPTIICSSIDKKRWVTDFPRKLFFKDDPYEQAFEYLLERYAHFLNSQSGKNIVGSIVMEDRGNKAKNRKLIAVLENLKTYGNNFHKGDYFKSLNTKIEFHGKKLNIPGLQLSDYFVYPFYINHKSPQSENLHYDFLSQFIYRGDFARYGYKKWPV